MMNAYYVPGQAAHTVYHMQRALKEYQTIFKLDELREFCQKYIQGGLLSFGDLGLSKRFNPKEVVAKFSENIKTVVTSPFQKGKVLFRDSGGFQIQTNKVSKRRIPSLLDAHIALIRMHHGTTKSFSLDIVPPENGSPFTSFREVFELNRNSLDATIKLDPAMRRTVYAIHQFKTPRLHQIYHRLFFDEQRARYFNNWAVGGIASSQEGFTTGYIPWVLPLIEIASDRLNSGKMEFGFHLLGNAEFADDITKVLFVKLLEDIHSLKVTFTWDTNTIYNGFSFDHRLRYAEEASKTIHSMTVHPYDLYRPDLGLPLTPAAMKFYELSKKLVLEEQRGFITPETIPFYQDESPTFFFYLAAVQLYFKAHTLSTQWCVEESDNLYSMWKNGQQAGFSETLAALMERLDGSNIPVRVAQTLESMELLKRLDPMEAAAAIRRDMRGHEFPCLLT